MIEDFKNRVYQDTWRRNEEFKQFNDDNHFWIELDYFIYRDAYKNRLNKNWAQSPQIDWNVCAENGLKIFRDFDYSQVSDRDYRLIGQNIAIANSDEDIYKVTEIYGYAPNENFVLYDSLVINRCGVRDPAGKYVVAFAVNSNANISEEYDYLDVVGAAIEYDSTEDVYILSGISTAVYEKYNIGDNVILYTSTLGGTYTYPKTKTPYTPITDKKDGKIYIKATNATAINGSASYDVTTFVFLFNQAVYKMLIRNYTIRQPQNRKVTTKQVISYLTALPSVFEQKFIPTSGGVETNTITETTVPTVDTWKKLIAGTATAEDIANINGLTTDGYMQVEDAGLIKRYNLYVKTLTYSKCV